MSPNEKLVRNLYDAFARRDNDALRRIFSGTVEWNQMAGFPRGGRYVGPDEVFTKVFKGFRDEWSEWAAVASEYIDAGDRIIAIGYYKGVHKATGRAFRADFAHVYQVSGGRVVKFDQYADTLKVAEAMGLAPVSGG